jgi:hypothetical protein
MSEAMLRDRFRLEASFERVELPVYALVMERTAAFLRSLIRVG